MNLTDVLEITSATDPGMVRSHNEDSVAADAANGLVVLADGMGGYNAGEVASGMATTVIITEMQQSLQVKYGNQNSNVNIVGTTSNYTTVKNYTIPYGRMFSEVEAEFDTIDVFVSNARPELAAFFQPPFDITLEQWDSALDSQAKAFLVGAREASAVMPDGGRIVAVTYATGSRTGGLQPWVAMGAAKAAMEATMRYLAVALAPRRITVNAVSPSWTEDSVLTTLPTEVQELLRDWHHRTGH